MFDTGPFNFSADYFLIDVSDRIGITSNFSLDDTVLDGLLAQGIDSARAMSVGEKYSEYTPGGLDARRSNA